MSVSKKLSAVAVRMDGQVLIVTLNRPKAMNAWTIRMADELVEIFRLADLDDTVRAIILTGAGKRAFCAGADLNMVSQQGADGVRQLLEPALVESLGSAHTERDTAGRVVLAMLNCRKVCVAAMNGSAVGVGMTMTLGCDARIVAEDASCGFVFARRGLVPEGCSSYLLTRLVGQTRALDWTLTGRVFKARDVADAGLFTRVVPRDQVLSTALAYARDIADNCSPTAVIMTRALMWRGLMNTDSPEMAHLLESKAIDHAFRSDDIVEGISSFMAKRQPNFPPAKLPSFYPWWNTINVDRPAGGVMLRAKL